MHNRAECQSNLIYAYNTLRRAYIFHVLSASIMYWHRSADHTLKLLWGTSGPQKLLFNEQLSVANPPFLSRNKLDKTYS